jgi:hypothetical protein
VKAIKKEFKECKESEEYKEGARRNLSRRTFGELSRVAWRRRKLE